MWGLCEVHSGAYVVAHAEAFAEQWFLSQRFLPQGCLLQQFLQQRSLPQLVKTDGKILIYSNDYCRRVFSGGFCGGLHDD